MNREEVQMFNMDEIYVMDYISDKSLIDNHYHRFIELVFIVEGTCTHSYLGNETTLNAGDVFIIVPGEDHSYIGCENVVFINCLFFSDFLESEWESLKKMSGIYDFIVLEPLFRYTMNNDQILHLNSNEFSHIHYLLLLIQKEYESKAAGYQIAAKTYMLAVLMSLGRLYEQTSKGKSHIKNRSNDLIDKAIYFMNQNLSNHLLIDEIASKTYLCPDYFRRIFREVTGLSPVRYMNGLRVDKAKELLKNTDLSIGDIGESVGIYQAGYFSRLFTKSEGISPRQYRKSLL